MGFGISINGEVREFVIIRNGEREAEIQPQNMSNMKLKQGEPIKKARTNWHDCQMEDLNAFIEKYPVGYLDSGTRTESEEKDFYRKIWNRMAGHEHIASSSKKFSVSEISFDGFEFVSLAANYPFECEFDPHSSFQWHLLLKMRQYPSSGSQVSKYPVLAIIGRTAGYNVENPEDEESDAYVVMFYYHASDQKLINTLASRCKTTKKEVKPQISYLCQGMGGLFYKETPVARSDFDFINYNEDFAQVDASMKEWAAKEESCGLSILHGEPGTGKTYYLRHLAGHIKNLTYIPSGIAHQIGDPAFITFLSENPGRVFVIEDAEGVLVSDGERRSSALQNLLNATDGLMGDIIKSKFIFTFNTGIENIDQALLRGGRAAVVYKFDKLSEARTSALCEKLGCEKKAAQMTLSEIYNADVSGVSGLKKEQRKIGFCA